MSMYGEDGDQPYGYKKEDLYYELCEFLKYHKLSELMSVLSDVFESVISDVLEHEFKDDE